MAVNKAIIVGNLGQNVEVKHTASGQAVATLSIATNESWTDKQGQKKEHTEWHRVNVWGKTAENCAKYLTKGKQVYVEGKLQTRKWQDKDGKDRYTTEIQALNVQFLGSAGGGERPPHPADQPGLEPPTGVSNPSMGAAPAFTDEDIPF